MSNPMNRDGIGPTGRLGLFLIVLGITLYALGWLWQAK